MDDKLQMDGIYIEYQSRYNRVPSIIYVYYKHCTCMQ